jgi:TolB-like protein/tRNA A-37 threonylcarbamoyl transferase component Bud32
MSEFPQAVERFEVERVLGQGGMGTVYLARDARLGRQVAVKVLHDKDLSNDEKRARFLREARTAAAIRHPNVATIYEVGETDEGAPFIVMEYCLGETLAQRVRRRPIEAGEFLVIARQLAAGLSAAHEAGIIHRDLKTANVIVEPTGAAKILDFGLAKPVRRELDKTVTLDSSSGRFFGTLHFLSPEQARGLPADARSDLFALGVVLYQMATGHLPFNADAPLLVLDKIRDDEPEPFVPLDPAFPTTAARIIGRLLQKQPEQRYQTAKELLEDLQQIDSPTARFNASVTHHTRSALGRTIARPRWIRVAIIIVAAAVLGTGIWFARNAQRLPVTPEAPPAAPEPIKSMAVMPLQNIANSTRDDFLSVGLADALTTKLQSIPSLQVRPTSAVLEFRNHKVDTKDASSKLHVDSLLEGHFLAAGNLVRVNLQLTDARTGYSVWADSIDGRREDLLKLIDDVSSRTVAGLNQKLGVQQQSLRGSEPRSSSPKAFEEYLKARALGNSLVPAEHAQQVTYLKRAIDLDPKFAAAYADLAIVLSLGQTRGLETDPQTALHAERYARQAVRLDPNLAGAHLALGRTLVKFNDRFREATRENLAALRLNARDAQSIWTIGSFFVSTGDMVQAQCISDYLVRLDPDSNEAKTRGYWYVNAVDAEDALKVAPDALASRDSELAGHDIRGSAFLLQGDLAQAQKESAAVKALVPHHYLGRSLDAMIAAASGDRAAAGAALAALEPDAQRNHWAAMRAALSYAKLGERDKAIFWMKHSAELGNHSWYAWIRHPWLQPLQADPEFQQIAGQIRADLDDVRDDVMGVYGLICK